MEDILTGVKKRNGEYVMIRDRKEAIRYCILHAQEGDVIVLAGKGHEDYQEINGVKYPMDERILIREILEEMSEEERDGKMQEEGEGYASPESFAVRHAGLISCSLRGARLPP